MNTSFETYAVQTRSGPHVTVQAGLVHAARFWTTTSRSSLKTRSIRSHGVASAVTTAHGETRVISGRTTAFRLGAIGPLIRDPVAPVVAGGAVARLGLANLEQLVGYAEAARSVPADWLPHRRALLVTRIDRSLRLEGDHVVEVTGTWADRATGGPTAVSAGPMPDLPIDHLPSTHRGVVDGPDAHVGVSAPEGPVALPATWIGEGAFAVSSAALAAVGAPDIGPAVALFADSTSRRPDGKLGVMFRGSGRVRPCDDDRSVLAIDTERITTWDGFSADTVTV